MADFKADDISSAQNPRIKHLIRLRDRKSREQEGVFLIEGSREILRAISGQVQIEECYFCPEALSDDGKKVIATIPHAKFFRLSTAAFSKVAMREGSDGVVVTAYRQASSLADLSPGKDLFLVAIEGVEKPGNLGAILRTADAIGLDGVVVFDNRCDPFSPNVIRASIGAVFHIPVIATSQTEFFNFCRDRAIKIFGAALSPDAVSYTEADYRGGAAILCGSEAHGLSDFWLKNSSVLVKIPMLGVGDSLNVSVAAAVICFEAARQRTSVRGGI